jgi:Pentapeptide repeats (8 copies)
MGVHLTGVHLTGVYLTGVHLIGVHLMGVHLTGVYLMRVHLMGVHLMGVCLMGVHLTGVHLICVHLTGVHLMGYTSWSYTSQLCIPRACISWACRSGWMAMAFCTSCLVAPEARKEATMDYEACRRRPLRRFESGGGGGCRIRATRQSTKDFSSTRTCKASVHGHGHRMFRRVMAALRNDDKL